MKKLSNPSKAIIFQRFFKTDRGEYGEGDKFIGITVPNLRKVALKYKDTPLSKVLQLLKSKIHEERMVALFILIEQFEKADLNGQKRIADLYLNNTKYINNWDLVDLSASKILGAYLYHHHNYCASTIKGEPLQGMAKSKNLWERRIAIVATFYFIKKDSFALTLAISETLLNDEHDLIHKAVGWMLREVGKRDQKKLTDFLKKYGKKMPRTMLRYSIERFPEKLRQKYLKKTSQRHVGF